MTSESVAGVPIGHLNYEAKLVAKSSVFPGESKTGPNSPYRGWFGGLLFISDLLVLNICVSLGFKFARKDFHLYSLWSWMSLLTFDVCVLNRCLASGFHVLCQALCSLLVFIKSC